MSAAGRHRHAKPAAPVPVRFDRSSRLALTFLAFAGLVGPAWTLRDHTDRFLGGPDHRPAAAPDASLPRIAADP